MEEPATEKNPKASGQLHRQPTYCNTINRETIEISFCLIFYNKINPIITLQLKVKDKECL